MSQFFARDFTQDRWRKAALKNAYSLLGKQRFDHAAAFFLLAGSLWDAIQVPISRLISQILIKPAHNDSCCHFCKSFNVQIWTNFIWVNFETIYSPQESADPYLSFCHPLGFHTQTLKLELSTNTVFHSWTVTTCRESRL